MAFGTKPMDQEWPLSPYFLSDKVEGKKWGAEGELGGEEEEGEG